MAQLPSGMVSFLFTDIEGSTRMFSRLGDDYHDVLADHNTLLRAVWKEFDGYEVRTEGDSFFVAYESAAAALDASVAAQRTLNEHEWTRARPTVRVGVHSGLGVAVDDDYVALAVHQAARVVGAAHGNQSLATATTVELAAEETGASAEPLGHYRLRSFDDPVMLYQVSEPGQWSDFPPLRAVPADGHNIVRPLTSFVGREADIAAVGTLVDESTLVTILGTGGVGKTRLSGEVGTRLAASFDAGVWLADLSPAEPSSPVGGVIASALGVQPGGRDPVAALSENLGTGDVLLILDTCEHVRDSVGDVVDRLLRGSEGLTVLATSRVPLGLDYERIWHLEPLPAGHGQGGAEQLFVERLGSSQMSEVAREAISALVDRLDGIPLAIELAAARARSASPESVLAMLDDRSRFLRVRKRGADPRQESLAAVLDWSSELLEPVERQVFARLGIFESSFSEDTGTVAAADDSIDRLDVAEAIWALADHSLLTRVESENETRYRMLGTVQAYANQQLDASDELGAAGRLAEWFLGRLGPAVPVTDRVMDEMRVEFDNLRALIPLLQQEKPETAQLLALSILRFLDDDGDYVSGVREADLYVSDLPAPTNARPILLARAARSHHRLGETDTEELLDEAQRLIEDVGPEPEWASGTIGIERVERLAVTGQVGAAIAMATDALDGDLPDRGRVAWLLVLGMYVMGDDPAQAVAYLEEGLSMTPENQPADVMVLHSNVAEALMRVDEHARAADHQLAALRIAAQLGMSMFVAVSLILAARLRAAESSWEEAIRLHAAADRLIAEAGAVLHPEDVELSERMLGAARAGVGDAYDDIRDAGYQLTIADATVEGIRALEGMAQA